MILRFISWSNSGRFLVQNVDVNSHNSCGRNLQHGCGFARLATKSILANAKQIDDFDVEHAQQYSPMFRTCRK